MYSLQHTSKRAKCQEEIRLDEALNILNEKRDVQIFQETFSRDKLVEGI
jgi:hypothetical protein